MVLTQLQLKWPNHSTQLLTGLKYLFKNEQLVDCTLKCNKHTLKVHRSVLAACSPYFERELENNPLIVIKDMQFNVLQALIEFMYYGETRITEENLTSLIEAAKLFEIKGLSEMDLFTSTENNVLSSVVSVNMNCTEESSLVPKNIDDMIFENRSQALKSQIDEGKTSVVEFSATISKNVPNDSLPDNEDMNSNLMIEDTIGQSHSSRNFVITPPQTESAKILLQLACSYSQKQYSNEMPTAKERQNGTDDGFVDRRNCNNSLLYNDRSLAIPDSITSSSSSSKPNSIAVASQTLPRTSLLHHTVMAADSLTTSGVAAFIDSGNAATGDYVNTCPVTANSSDDPPFIQQQPLQESSGDCRTSLLETLLTQSNQKTIKIGNNNVGSDSIRYEHMYDVVEPSILKHHLHQADQDSLVEKVVAVASSDALLAPVSASTTVSAGVNLPPDIIPVLEYPFLIETSDGYVDVSVENMLNVLENGNMFAGSSKNAVKIIPKEQVISLASYALNPSIAAVVAHPVSSTLPAPQIDEESFSDPILERIQLDTEQELNDDPEAVVLTRVNDDGVLEKFVLSSADVKALQLLNDERHSRRRLEAADGAFSATKTPSTAALAVDIESPVRANGAASLITRVVQFDASVDNALSKLPFRKVDRPLSSSATDAASVSTGTNSGVSNLSRNSSLASSAAAVGETALLGDVTLQTHHQSQPHSHPHHENMFEELDSQFSTDCSIERIQREYVAYEEASKNETQLEHNYYANAMKDEDEECVVIGVGDNFNELHSLMLVEQPALVNGNGLTSDKRGTGAGAASAYQHIGAVDVYLNNGVAEKKEHPPATASNRRNGLVVDASCSTSLAAPLTSGAAGCSSNSVAAATNRLFNGGGGGKSDLISKKDALMNSVATAAASTFKTVRLTNGTAAKSGIVAAPAKKSRGGSGRGGNAAAAAVQCDSGSNPLPFKTVKNASRERKQPRRTFKRKASASEVSSTRKSSSAGSGGESLEKRRNENVRLNGGGLFVEEIIVDEIS